MKILQQSLLTYANLSKDNGVDIESSDPQTRCKSISQLTTLLTNDLQNQIKRQVAEMRGQVANSAYKGKSPQQRPSRRNLTQ